jgi:hypothetical protein
VLYGVRLLTDRVYFYERNGTRLLDCTREIEVHVNELSVCERQRERERQTVTLTALMVCFIPDYITTAMMPDPTHSRPPLLENLGSTSTFRRFRKAVEKATIGLAIPVRPTVYNSAKNSAPPTGRNFAKFYLGFLMKYLHTF